MTKRDDSLCWECIHSAAPEELQCIWDKTSGRTRVEGALVVWGKKGKNNGKSTCVGTVRKCPEFETIYSLKNRMRVEEERERAKKDLYAKYHICKDSGHNSRLSTNEI